MLEKYFSKTTWESFASSQIYSYEESGKVNFIYSGKTGRDFPGTLGPKYLILRATRVLKARDVWMPREENVFYFFKECAASLS